MSFQFHPDFPKWKLDAILKNEFICNEFGDTSEAGVYMICIMREKRKESYKYHPEEILYIGSSKCIKKRLEAQDHPYHKIRATHSLRTSNTLVYTKEFKTQDYLNVERELIRYINPEYNKRKYQNYTPNLNPHSLNGKRPGNTMVLE